MPSGPSITGRVPTRSLHLLVLTLLIALIPWLTAAPAHAADNSVLGIVVRTVTPVVAGASDPITLQLDVSNSASSPSAPTTLNVLLGTERLDDTAAVDAWAAGHQAASGRLVAQTEVPAIPAGSVTPLTVTLARAGDLTRRPYDVVALSLEIGSAITHTFVGVQRAKEFEPLSVAWLVPVTLVIVALGLTLIALIVSMMTFLGQLSYGFAPTPPILLLALIFVLSLSGFIINESRQKSPLLDLSIFRYRMFVLPSISLILFFVANLMITVLGPFYFEGVRGYTASQVGLIFLIVPAITVFGAPLTGAVYDRHQFRYLAALGMSIMALSMIALGFLAMGVTTDIRQLLICFVFIGLGAAFFQSPNNTELMRALPVSKINIASSFTATIRNLGMALGVSLSGLLVSLQMAEAGYYGTISDAGPAILASSISRVVMIAGGLCIISAIVAIYRGSKMRE